MSKKLPKISVIMPVYNAEKYLAQAITSILTQTFKDFEFLIIDDASTDGSRDIIKSFQDPRIKLIINQKNIGVTKSLNKGLGLAQGEFIARMDADDISLATRFEKQVNFLASNPAIGICGTWAKTIGENNGYVKKQLSQPDEIKTQMLFHTPLIHPTVMMRKDILDINHLKYDESLRNGQDYDLWSRALPHTKLSNIRQVLLLYRMHQKSESAQNAGTQRQSATTVRRRELKNLKINPTNEEMLIHASIKAGNKEAISDFLDKKEKWLSNLINQNTTIKYYQEPYFSNVIKQNWLETCYANSGRTNTWRRYWQSPLKEKSILKKYKKLLKLFIKNL